jgi:uracil-DNA glycosylase
MATVDWPAEFARVVSCTACSGTHNPQLLRDEHENVPQPGYIGEGYWRRRVLLVGQNPGTPKTLEAEDRPYTQALRQLRDSPNHDSYEKLVAELVAFIPQWPVHGNYFPLAETGLSLEDIAYFNVVRCRTSRDAKPGSTMIGNCIDLHFGRWLDQLVPKVVVFIGKWAADQAGSEVARRGIPFAFMNRQRSLSSEERALNRLSVVKLVRGDA